MKKILIFALTAVMLFCLTACGGNGTDAMPEDTAPQNNEVTNDMPTVDKNIPDPEVDGNSTGNEDSVNNHDQGGILDDAMDQITGQK